MENKKPSETKNQNITTLLLCALMVVMFIRLLPVLKSPLSTYGYDYGFYLYTINHAQGISAHDFTTAIGGGYNSPIFIVGNLLHIPANLTLNELYFLSFLASALACFYFFYPKNPTAGIFAALLCACSLAQAESYNLFLWKEAIAFPFLILAFKFLHEKKLWPCVIFSLAIFLTHRTTAVIYILTAVLYLLLDQYKNKNKRIIISIIISILLLSLVIFWPHINNIFLGLTNGQNIFIQQGVFFEGYNLWLMLLPAGVLGILGFIISIKKKQHLLLGTVISTAFVWMLLTLPFYRRVAPFFDLGCILYGAYFFSTINFNTWYKKLLAICFYLGLLIIAVIFVLDKNPLISAQEISEIQNFKQSPGIVVATSSIDGPWLLGYLNSQRLTTPGLFEDTHSYSQWQDFWHGQNRQEFLHSFPRPLYIYERSFPLDGPQNCLKQISQNFYQYICQ